MRKPDVFPVHIAHLAAAQHRGPIRKRPSGQPRSVGLALAAVALGTGLAPLFGTLFHDVHGDAVAAGVLIGLLSAGLGFGLARVIGRQG